MSKSKKPPNERRTIIEAMASFKETCERCNSPLEVIKFVQANHKRQEVITATCFNTNFKDLGVKCEHYGMEIRFRYCKWF